MTDLVLLCPGRDGDTPDAERVRRLVREERATVVSVHVPTVTDDGLDPDEFVTCYHRNGVDLAGVDDDFVLRDIILVKTPDRDSPLNFVLLHVWNWPDSTYDIDAVRIPHGGDTDPRNNPKGKNPGNIWAFSEQLNDRVRGTQTTLFGGPDPETVARGHLELEGVERLVECHTDAGDAVHVWADDADAERIAGVVADLDRGVDRLAAGEPDPPREIPVLTAELPVEPAAETEAFDELPEGELPVPEAGEVDYRICDCREGVSLLPEGAIEDVVTSPPYNIAYDPFNVPKPDPVTGEVRSPLREGYEDDMPAEQYHALLESTFEAIDRKMARDSADAFVNIKNNYSGGDCRPPFWLLRLVPDDWSFSDLLVWRYDISYDPAKNKYKPYYEWIFRFTRGEAHRPADHEFLQDYYIPILKGNSKERQDLVHPAIYPKELVGTCLDLSGHDGLVVDPFLGSGTTLAAARERGRPAVGFEKQRQFESDIETRLRRAKRFQQGSDEAGD